MATQREWDAKRAGTAKRRASQERYRLKMARSPRTRYRAQKNNAKRRGIAFRLTFEQWLVIWLESGHWAEYGKAANQYQMTRFGDVGAYEVGNVEIKRCDENSREVALRIGLADMGHEALRRKR